MSVTKSDSLCRINRVVESKIEGYPIILCPMRIADLTSVRGMYDSLSHESKSFIPSQIFGSQNKSWYWVLGQAALILSCNRFSRAFLRWVYPRASFFLVVAKNKGVKGILGFAYLRAERVKGHFFLGICVKDAYQGVEIGSRLMEELIAWARREGAEKIVLSTHANNTRAISLYKKYGFRVICHDSEQYEMDLELSNKEVLV